MWPVHRIFTLTQTNYSINMNVYIQWLKVMAVLIVTVNSSPLLAQDAQGLHPINNAPNAYEFSLQDTEGKKHVLKQYRGKVVLLNFWATWCPPCRFELPSMERAYQKLKKKNIEILAIDIGEDADTIFTFTADYPVSFPLLMDLDSHVINHYPVIGLPTTFIIDKQGRLRYRAIGTRNWDDESVIQLIDTLL